MDRGAKGGDATPLVINERLPGRASKSLAGAARPVDSGGLLQAAGGVEAHGQRVAVGCLSRR